MHSAPRRCAERLRAAVRVILQGFAATILLATSAANVPTLALAAFAPAVVSLCSPPALTRSASAPSAVTLSSPPALTLAAVAPAVVSLAPTPESAAPGEIRLACPDSAWRLSTGSASGECFSEPGVRAVCLDTDSNSASARCDAGCLGSNGTGSCSLPDEEGVGGGTLVLSCADGARFLLRTGTRKGRCSSSGEGSARTARCADGKIYSAEATCKAGCGSIRGSGYCARYKREATANPPAPVPP